jgi:hypothetical protein
MAMEKQNHLFSDNPITRAELSYQQQPTPQRRRWRRLFGWISRAVTIFAYVLAFCVLASEVVMALLNLNVQRGLDGSFDVVESMGVLNFVPICVVVVMHFSLMIQALSRSANSVARERQANNWDILVLTGIDASRIAWGKWWATVRYLWWPYLRLGLFRAAIIIGYGLSMSRPYYYYYANQNYNRPDVITPTLPHFIVATFFICVLTFANLFFTAACGVSAFNKRSSIAMARAIGTRLLILIAIIMVTVFIGWLLFRGMDYIGFNVVQQIGLRSLLTLFENGVSLGGELVSYRYDVSIYGDYPDTSTLWFPGVLISLAVYGLLTWLLLRFAQWQAVRLNALPSLRRKWVKVV